MYNIEYLHQAEVDLESIYGFISEDSKEYAVAVVVHLKSTIEMLGNFPKIGTEYVGGTRKIVDSKYKYKIVYSVSEKNESIYIVRIVKHQNY